VRLTTQRATKTQLSQRHVTLLNSLLTCWASAAWLHHFRMIRHKMQEEREDLMMVCAVVPFDTRLVQTKRCDIQHAPCCDNSTHRLARGYTSPRFSFLFSLFVVRLLPLQSVFLCITIVSKRLQEHSTM